MKKEKVRIILTTLLAAVFLISAGMMIRQQIQYQKIAADSDEAAQIAGLQKGAASQRSASSLPVPAAEPEEPELPPEPLPEEALDLNGIDLEALRAVNEDVVGWIAIPGTTLSYPLMQGEDNQYYLSHSWKRESVAGGSVFLESTNNRDLTDYHTIAFAHRMRNDTMFGTIKYYKKLDFWQEHPRIYVVLDDTIYRYDIFSAQEANVKGIVYRLDIEENHLEEEFLQYCIENSVIDTGLIPEVSDRILTLSTCTGNGYVNRWVIHGALAQEYSREMSEE